MIPAQTQEFRPELLPRRGESTAWLLTLLVTSGMFLLQRTWGAIPPWAWFFWGFLLFAALSISLGNWMDRRTLMRVDSGGIAFENGLRRVRLGWPEVQKVNVLPTRWGSAVQVIGAQSYFQFKTLSEVQFQGEVRGRTGFAAGQVILSMIVGASNLQLIEESASGDYYART